MAAVGELLELLSSAHERALSLHAQLCDWSHPPATRELVVERGERSDLPVPRIRWRGLDPSRARLSAGDGCYSYDPSECALRSAGTTSSYGWGYVMGATGGDGISWMA